MLHLEDSVSETLLIPLYMKHLASQMPNPVIHDEAATRLVRQLDYDFSKYDHIIHTVVGTAIRADYFDRLTADFIQRRPNPVVVTWGVVWIAAGSVSALLPTAYRFTILICLRLLLCGRSCCLRSGVRRCWPLLLLTPGGWMS